MCCVCLVAQSCPILCDTMDCSPTSSSVHGISQARILEWVAIFLPVGSSQPRDQIDVSCITCIAGTFFYHLSHQGSPRTLEWVAYPFSKDLPYPGMEPESLALQADSLAAELPGKPSLLLPISYFLH